jgi:phosphate transport system substrate-binding protein
MISFLRGNKNLGILRRKKMKKIILKICLAAIILMLVSCISTVQTVEQKEIYSGHYIPFKHSKNLAHLDSESTLKFTNDDNIPVMDGATALFPIYCSFAEAVYPADCKINDFVHFEKTTGAYKRLISGEDDIIFVAEPSKEQLETAKEKGVEFNMYPIGYEAFVFIVNAKNPGDSLTLQQIKDIYSGKIKNWKKVGGKWQTIKPFQRAKNSGSQTAFVKIMGKDFDLIPPKTHKIMTLMDGMVNVVSDYENHNNAIGYTFRYFLESMNKSVDVKMLKINGVEPSVENIKNKTYPLTDNFYAITIKGKESENTKKLIEWILSDEGQKLVEKVGYVPLK